MATAAEKKIITQNKIFVVDRKGNIKFFVQRKTPHKNRAFVYNILFINIHYAINAIAFEHQIHL